MRVYKAQELFDDSGDSIAVKPPANWPVYLQKEADAQTALKDLEIKMLREQRDEQFSENYEPESHLKFVIEEADAEITSALQRLAKG